MDQFSSKGFEIFRNILEPDAIEELRSEVNQLTASSTKTCLRNLRAQSEKIDLLSNSPKFRSLLPNPELLPVRSILFDKTPDRNWPVLWHQDLTIAVKQQVEVNGYGPWSTKEDHPHVQPPLSLLENMATLRLHLDDTPASNGALSVIPKSHRHGKILTDNITDSMKTNAVVCECSAGDILMMSPLLLHSSARSTNPSRRRVIHIEYAQPDDLHPALAWLED